MMKGAENMPETEKILRPLTGHTSEETAYVVDDYPYGFRLRCRIRYWLEYKASEGFRFCSQTTNPKKAGEVWNKPKKSTYIALGIMGLDERNYVEWTGISMYYPEKLAAFVETYGASFDANQTLVATAMKAAYESYNRRRAARQDSTPIKLEGEV